MQVRIAGIESLEQDTYFEQCLREADVKTQQKVEHLKSRKQKMHCLASCLLLHRTLQQGGISEFTIGTIQNGKPVLLEADMPYFNLSHSGDYVALAVSDEAVGIDIQKKVSLSEQIAKRFFNAAEAAMCEDIQCDTEKADMLCKLWTIKESYIKLTGEGLRCPLDSFLVSLEESAIYSQTKEILAYFYVFEVEEYWCSVCSQRILSKPFYNTIGNSLCNSVEFVIEQNII